MNPQQIILRSQSLIQSLDPELTILILLATFTNIFTQILPYNKKSQTKIFMGCLIGVFAILKINEYAARTALFLMRIVLGEIVVIGVCVRQRRYIGEYFVGVAVEVGEKGREGMEWKCLYPIVTMVLVLFSIVGLVYAIHTDLYLQLLQFPQLPQMLTLITLGFIIVYLSDIILKKLTKSTSPNQINTIRRKIFHFVPVGLLPILSQISYRLFTLMVFGAFYLFWLVQVGRCFGMFGRIGDKKLKQKQDEQKQRMKIQQKLSNTGKQITKSSKSLKIIQLFHKLNIKISQLSFIKWMQQLNSSRQPYFWFTHLSLILGLSLTYIFYQPQAQSSPFSSQIPTILNQNMSIILIISDAIAAIIGRKYGKPSHRIPYTNKKTIEGYFGFVVTMVVLMLGYYFWCFWWYGVEGGVEIGVVVVCGLFCGVGELFSGDLDNFVCVFVYIFVEWSYRKYFSWA